MASCLNNDIGLCESCQKIPFDYLRCPTYSEFVALQSQDAEAIGKWFRPGGRYGDYRQVSTDLGKLKEIIVKREQCKLCELIWKVLYRRGPFSETGQSPEGTEIECYAITTYYGVLYPLNGDRDDCHISLRLSIFTAKEHTPKDWDDHNEQYCFQACTPGAAIEEPPSDLFAKPRGLEPTVYGGRKRPLTVNCDWLRAWIRICTEEHGDRCNPKLGCVEDDVFRSRTRLIRFVDTSTNAITSLKDQVLGSLEYVALSYVWGTRQKITLKQETKTRLAQPQSIVYGEASATIVDAVELCQKLGIRYLWVDALCIVQDDDNDKAEQLKAMSHIYSCASFTIVAASGQDAGAGLPGLRPGTRSFQQEEVLVVPATESKPAMGLMMTCNPKSTAKVHYLEDTKWNTRGWTFQERYLSNRCLVFTEEQVYFSCNEAIFCEESYSEYGPPYLQPFQNSGSELSLNIKQQYGEPDDASDRPWRRYHAVVERFTRRDLGFQGDVYDAFEGVQKALLNMFGEKCKLIWGLPCERLNLALTWGTFTGQVRRKDHSTLKMTNLNRRVTFPTWSWMGWIGETHISVTDERVELGDRPLIDIFCHIKHGSGVVIERVNHQLMVSDEQHIQLADIQDSIQSLTDAVLLNTPNNHILFLWAESSTFMVERSPERKLHIPGWSCNILDLNHKIVGKTGPMLSEHYDEYGSDTGEWEFMAISRRQLLDFEAVITAIQIRRQNGIAYRVNIGEIAEPAWKNANPTCLLLALG